MGTNSRIVSSFISSERVGVLSYISKPGRPSSALMEYASKGLEIFMCTSKRSGKYANMRGRNVAFEIHDGEETLQYEGFSRELRSGGALEEARSLLWKKNPLLYQWEKKERLAYFVIRPLWLKYTDFDKKPNRVITIDMRRVERKT
ncbi:MAG: hypothetical protein KGI00_01350 [Candidatus Micrarchaeota archaeon]|nr:hypothetical protein [Candidatus Micrarchaeota archaeon]MDE1824078.1 hypothetical protein [Candidatus Micrarchaeota archaeon]MDE1849355.1 hypothetical protein [Candidatus Micrarchaeota archaeon]